MRGSGRLIVFAMVLGVIGVASIPIVIGLRSSRGPGADTPPLDADGPRIVALSPAIADTLVHLGLEPGIVGRHAFDVVLDRSIPVIGDNTGVDYEALMRARPTHVLTQWGARGPPRRLVDLAERHAWTMIDFPLLTLDDILSLVRACEHIEGARAGAAEGLHRAWSPEPPETCFAGRVLLLWSTEPVAAMGPGSFHFQILERLGGRPALTEGSAYVRMDAEDVLRLDPDAIVLVRARDPGTPPSPRDRASIDASLGALARLDVGATRHGRVALIDDPASLLPSTSMGAFADDLRAVLRAWVAGPVGRP